MSTPRPAGPLGDELTNLGIGLLVGAAVLAAILRGAGSVAPSDYEGLARLNYHVRDARKETEELEARWLELSELAG